MIITTREPGDDIEARLTAGYDNEAKDTGHG